jgi:hypothetical protein
MLELEHHTQIDSIVEGLREVYDGKELERFVGYRPTELENTMEIYRKAIEN